MAAPHGQNVQAPGWMGENLVDTRIANIAVHDTTAFSRYLGRGGLMLIALVDVGVAEPVQGRRGIVLTPGRKAPGADG